jgi:tetratricopeptide (TPR) repeat protein
VYRDLNEHDKALENYSKALPVYEELDDKEGTADQSTNIAYIYVMVSNLEEALFWYKKALLLYDELNNMEKAGLTQQNITHIENLLAQAPKRS